MALKDYFVKKDGTQDDEQKVQPVKETSKKFPSAKTEETNESKFSFGFGKTVPAQTFSKGDVSPEHLAKAVERYQKGFESLNQAGYDFFEFHQAITSIGATNAQAYTMAYTMAKSMDKSITKETLLQQSEFYTSEINKSYQETINLGNSKKQELVNQKGNENQALTQELGYMKEQLETMKLQIQDRENKLAAIGSKYEPQINDIDSKLAANDTAKNQLIASIEQVKQGIINNLK